MPSIATRVAVLALSLGALGCNFDAGGTGLHVRFGRQASEQFQWAGRIGDGKRLEIKGVNGPIDARAARGDRVEVTADRHGMRSDPDEVRIEVVEHEGGVTICAVYPAEGNACLPGKEGRLRARGNDVKVHFDVSVPAGLTFVARTVNGRVDVVSLDGDVEAKTVNGSISISTARHARAETINGSIDAKLGRANWVGDTAFETVNGSVDLTLPRQINATVHASTSHGSISSDIPLDVTKSSRRRLEGTAGQGGRELRVETVNGSVCLTQSG